MAYNSHHDRQASIIQPPAALHMLIGASIFTFFAAILTSPTGSNDASSEYHLVNPLRMRSLRFYPDFECPICETCGTFTYAYSPDCNSYIKCHSSSANSSSGIDNTFVKPLLQLTSCPPNQTWDDSEKTCINDTEGRCPRLRYTCPAHNTLGGPCEGSRCQHPHPSGDTSWFFYYNKGEAYEKTCPPGLEYIDSKKSCTLSDPNLDNETQVDRNVEIQIGNELTNLLATACRYGNRRYSLHQRLPVPTYMQWWYQLRFPQPIEL